MNTDCSTLNCSANTTLRLLFFFLVIFRASTGQDGGSAPQPNKRLQQTQAQVDEVQYTI